MLQGLPTFTAVCFLAVAGALPAAGAAVSSQQGHGYAAPTGAYSISGRMSGAAGVKVGGIAVRLEGYSTEMGKESQGAVTASVTTAADGTYTFSNLGPGAYVTIPKHRRLIFTPARQGVAIWDASVTDINFSGARATGQDSTVVPPPPASTYSISGTISGDPGVNVSEIGILAQLDLPRNVMIAVARGFAYIRLGKESGIRQKMKLEVYRVAEGFPEEDIGRMVVVDVQQDISLAEITEAAAGIWTGDQLRELFTPATSGGGAYTFKNLAPGVYTVVPIGPPRFTPTKQVVVVRNANVTGVNFAAAVRVAR